MKKTIKSSVLFLGACFFAGALNAQLSSDKPAMTAQQMNDLIQKRKTEATQPATTKTSTVTVSSDKPSMTAQQSTDLLEKRKADVKVTTAPVENSKTAVTTTSATATTSHGDVKTVITAPVPETKVQTVPMQSDKPIPVKQQ